MTIIMKYEIPRVIVRYHDRSTRRKYLEISDINTQLPIFRRSFLDKSRWKYSATVRCVGAKLRGGYMITKIPAQIQDEQSDHKPQPYRPVA